MKCNYIAPSFNIMVLNFNSNFLVTSGYTPATTSPSVEFGDGVVEYGGEL